MKFKGTIIITDPCYIVKDLDERLQEAGITIKCPSFSNTNPENFDEDFKSYREEVKKYHEQVDPYDDWKTCEYGNNMEALGFTCYISKPTIYGDWSCTTWSTPCKNIKEQIRELNTLYNKRSKAAEEDENSEQYKSYDKQCKEATRDLVNIGSFCADAGMVSVLLLDEVLKYNSSFSKWIDQHSKCVTVIPDFDGDVEYHVDEDNNVYIIGVGNINFYTTQIGL